MKKWYSASNICLALVVVLLIISLGVVVTLNFRPLYYHDMEALDISARSGVAADVIKKNYDILIDYNSMFYHGQLEFPDFEMSESGRIHFEEVKVIFVAFQYMAIVTFVLAAIGIFIKYKKKDFGFLFPAAALSVGIPTALGAFIALNWDRAFVLFHEIAFNNDYWIFDYRTDPIITVLPDEFFMHCAIMILASVILGALICLIAGMILRNKYKGPLRGHGSSEPSEKRDSL